MNSCGPTWMPEKLNKILFGWFFHASCDEHDKNYTAGGSEYDRLLADIFFLADMITDVLRLPWLQKLPASILMVLYFLAVRFLGFMSFSYKRDL